MSPCALLTDFYQLTMMSGYHDAKRLHEKCSFELFFRKIPDSGGFCVAAGLDVALTYLETLRFEADDVEYLRSLKVFPEAFADYLKEFRFTCDAWAVPEGTLVFAHQPLMRIQGDLIQAQLVESALLNILNFQTLIATKASRVCYAAAPGEVLEFGLRRAQGPDGAISASRAAYIGGCSATSNTLAGKVFGIPVKGTQAHSWIMSFSSELEAFRAYAERFPNTCLLLVDTYDTLKSGVPNAIQVAKELAEKGHRLAGIRLDSGDLAVLSVEARKMLDEAGFPDAKIVASNDLDEYIIDSLQTTQGAKIDQWGVGTQLVTSKQAPALGGVYKLVEIGGRPTIKVSSNPAKITNPGVKQVFRALDADGNFVGDCLALADEEPSGTIYDPLYVDHVTNLEAHSYEPLLQPVMRGGKAVWREPLHASRERTLQQVRRIPQNTRRLHNPHIYPMGLSKKLFELRHDMLEEIRGKL